MGARARWRLNGTDGHLPPIKTLRPCLNRRFEGILNAASPRPAEDNLLAGSGADREPNAVTVSKRRDLSTPRSRPFPYLDYWQRLGICIETQQAQISPRGLNLTWGVNLAARLKIKKRSAVC